MTDLHKSETPTVTAIKHTLSNLGVPLSKLSNREFICYLEYRVASLVNKRFVLSAIELKYLLCETGPGNLRFDPEIIDILLASEKTSLDDLGRKMVGKHHYLLHPITSKKTLSDIIAAKHDILKTISSRKTQQKVLEALVDLIETVAQKCNVSVSEISIAQNTIEFVIQDKALVRYFPNRWIYLHSAELWQLYEKAIESNLGAVVLSPKIHGICFPVFKELGLFGFNTYTRYLTDSSLRQIEEFNSAEWPRNVSFTPGNIASVDHESQILGFFQHDFLNHAPTPRKLTKEEVVVLYARDWQNKERLTSVGAALKPVLTKRLEKNISTWLKKRAKLMAAI